MFVLLVQMVGTAVKGAFRGGEVTSIALALIARASCAEAGLLSEGEKAKARTFPFARRTCHTNIKSICIYLGKTSPLHPR